MIALEMTSDVSSHEQPAPDTTAPDAWAEHGWSLTGAQTGLVLLVIATVSILLKAAGL